MIAAIQTPDIDWFGLSPILALLGASGLALLGAVLVPRPARKPLAAVLVGAGFATAIVLSALVYEDTDRATTTVAGAFAVDRWAALAQLILFGAGLLTVALSWRERWTTDEHAGEFLALLAATGAGMGFFVGANDLMTLFLGLEWFSIGLYVLCAIAGDREPSLEAGLKYLVVGSFGSAVLLFGSALVYGATGELRFGAIADAAVGDNDVFMLVGLAMMLSGLGFKASAAPFHMWTPDVYEGSPTPVTAFMAAATKVAAVVLMFRVLVTAFPQYDEFWTTAVAAIAVISLAVGNLAALVQRSVKRMLAYSSVSHAGFLLIAVAAANELGATALLFYLVPYAAMSVGAFAVVAARERELGRDVVIDDLAGWGWERPFLGIAMWVFMLGFAGMPLTGGLIGKFYVFSAAYEADMTWLVIVGVVATAVSLFYYLNVVRALYMRAPEPQLLPAGGSPPREAFVHGVAAVCVAVTVGSFFAVQPLIDLARDAAQQLPL
ncbi:MAG: NADH-quinone oxidoreductase subunit N [Pseudomonadota bacterium]